MWAIEGTAPETIKLGKLRWAGPTIRLKEREVTEEEEIYTARKNGHPKSR